MKKRARLWNLINSKQLFCCICGQLITDIKQVSREHEPPLSRGGERDKWKYAHKGCNNHKGALTLEEYKLFLELLAKKNGRQK